jgi:hypothetical protein
MLGDGGDRRPRGRYASKEDLLRRLCGDGLKVYIAAEAALADEGDPWEAFAELCAGWWMPTPTP